MDLLIFVLSKSGLATFCAMIFLLGGIVGFFVVRYRVEHLMVFPLWIARWVQKLVSPNASLARVAAVIFLFNGTAMFLYMLTGIGVIFPIMIDFLTGMHIIIIMLAGPMARMTSPEASGDLEEPKSEGPAEPLMLPASRRFAGLMVFFLELPAFWFTIAMGMTIGFAVRDLETWPKLVTLIEQCVQAYLRIILPVLFLSAILEAYAVHGLKRETSQT